MKSTTVIHTAIKNIGDSTDQGQFFEGSARDSILWLATQITNMTMQTRIVIGIGRDQMGARKGITMKRVSPSGELASVELGDELDALMNGGFDADPSNPQDDWKGPTS